MALSRRFNLSWHLQLLFYEVEPSSSAGYGWNIKFMASKLCLFVAETGSPL